MSSPPKTAAPNSLGGGLPPAPDEALAPFLDAAERCIERYGWSRTGAKDIAREAGVERTTIYRRLGSKDNILRLLVARELNRLVQRAFATALSASEGEGRGPEVAVEIVATSVEYIWQHPAMSKLLSDDSDLLSRFLTSSLGDIIRELADATAPALAAAMGGEMIAGRDPRKFVEWVVRVGITLILAPPEGDLREFLGLLIVPALSTEGSPG